MAVAKGGGSFKSQYGTFKYAQPGTLHLPGTPAGPDQVPDYNALVQQNPGYRAWESNRDLQVGNAAAARRAAVQHAILSYGGLPPGMSDPYGDADPATLALAQNNPESQQAQLQRNYGQQQQALQNSLAARGALHSGDLVQGQQTLDQSLQDSTYGAGQTFGNDFNTAVGNYTDAYANAWSGQGAALTAAGTQEAGLHPTVAGTPAVAGAAASLVPNWATTYGRPVYSAGGKLYLVGADGGLVPYTPPAHAGGATAS